MQGQFDYKHVAASATDTALASPSGSGGTQDYVEQLICVVTTAATSAVSLKDGASGSAIPMLPDNVGGGVGTYNIYVGMKSRAGAWLLTTGAGVAVTATGNFA